MMESFTKKRILNESTIFIKKKNSKSDIIHFDLNEFEILFAFSVLKFQNKKFKAHTRVYA